MQNIEIEYNQELRPLEGVLSGVKQPGNFFVSGAMEMPMPRVEIEGAGTLSFPVPDAQIAAIVRRAERAPYGKGKDTIVDTSVRGFHEKAGRCQVVSLAGLPMGRPPTNGRRDAPSNTSFLGMFLVVYRYI